MMSELEVGLWSSRMAASGSSGESGAREQEFSEGLGSTGSNSDGEVVVGSSTAGTAAENDESLWTDILW
jgi:hypothetical protein